MDLTMTMLLDFLVERDGSDLHLSAEAAPRVRVDGELRPLSVPALTPEEATTLIYSILTDDQIQTLEKTRELDISYELKGVSRFRVNVSYQRGRLHFTARYIPDKIRTFAELQLPEKSFDRICRLKKGLVLVTGATGSGKSTTLAAIIDAINSSRENHIVTIEDPVEFVHQDKRCMISQREIGSDTLTFAAALRHVLRQDPDVILIGEMRDPETVEVGLELAETGHLTFATLHTSDAAQTINRIIDVFPAARQPQVRTQLGFVLEAIVCQQLIRRKDGQGRVPALEILFATQGVRANIRTDKVHQLYSTIQTNLSMGMITMNQSLVNLVREGLIDEKTAVDCSSRADEIVKLLAYRPNEAEEGD